MSWNRNAIAVGGIFIDGVTVAFSDEHTLMYFNVSKQIASLHSEAAPTDIDTFWPA